jgi:hypothetical protein
MHYDRLIEIEHSKMLWKTIPVKTRVNLPQIEIKVSQSVSQLKREMVKVQIDRFCFCSRDLMSVCTAGSVDEQKKCRLILPSGI